MQDTSSHQRGAASRISRAFFVFNRFYNMLFDNNDLLQWFQRDVWRHGLEVDREHAYSALAKEWKRPYPIQALQGLPLRPFVWEMMV
jgi:hypothetical protein